MIDSSILARQCAPEAPDVAPTVLIADLWKWTYQAVEKSAAHDALIDRWAREEYRDRPTWREKWGLTSVVHEMMTCGLMLGDFVVRLHDGVRAWRLPNRAFAGWRPDIDLEMTWTGGRLWQFEASEDFRAIADLELPLLATEDEADAFRRRVSGHIAELEAAPDAVDQIPDPEQQRLWVTEWSGKVRWPLREALLWVAMRDIDEVAKTVLTSWWAGNERDGLAGAILAQIDIKGQRSRRIVEIDPASRLLQALQGGLPASGLFEGEGPMTLIDALQWENLMFGVAPDGQRGKSDAWQSAACINDQIIGVAWRGHWTGVLIARTDLFEAFPPVTVGEGEPDDLGSSVNEKPQAGAGGPVRRAGEGTLERRFKEWVWAQLEQNCLPDLVQTYGFARSHGHTRNWARERLKKLPAVLRLSNGMRRQRPEISEEQRAAYLAHFGPI